MRESAVQKRIVLSAFVLAVAVAPLTFGANRAAAQSDELVLVVRVAPQYPPRALQRGRSGHVTLRFTVTVHGTTKDIEVVESSSSVFEQPAVEALSKWRYAPPVENGVPVEKRGVQTVIRFDS